MRKLSDQANYSLDVENLSVYVFDNDIQMGQAASDVVIKKLKDTIQDKGEASMILATGASQFRFLESLRENTEILWSKVNVFHLDEYINLSEEHPASFRKYLYDRIINYIQPKNFYALQGDAKDLNAEIERYEDLLMRHDIDVACIGIGENGHIAFNEPLVSDFNDPNLVKIIELDEMSRMQQLNEGWFNSLEEVPQQALSLTIPAIMKSKYISCFVPDKRKSEAVHQTLSGPVNNECPATILRRHPDSVLFLDTNAACLINID